MSKFLDDHYEPKVKYFAGEDLDFQAGDSQAVLDVEAEIGIAGIDGEILPKSNTANEGNILVELSADGTNYGNQFTVFYGSPFSLFGHSVKKIRITHSGTDSGYRVVAR